MDKPLPLLLEQRPPSMSRSYHLGANNPQWTGDSASYEARHVRVRKSRGKADHCYNHELGLRACTSTTYSWSQLHGSDGLDPLLDYYPLCATCHHAYDQAGVPLPSIQGSKHPSAKLTEEIVAECRSRRYDAGETVTALALEFGVSISVMSHALTGRNWGHVPINIPANERCG
jgi:hypothetical protein